jgi:hypothetical protein
MTTYKVTGPFDVAGKEPGTILAKKDLVDLNLDWLIESGHIESTDGASAPSETPEAAPAAEVITTQAAEATTTQEG